MWILKNNRNMNGDILILAAFAVFVVLLVWRMKERFADLQRQEEQAPLEEKSRLARIRKGWRVSQLVVLGGLAIYMVPFLWADFHHLGQREMVEVVLRCLIFIFTICVLLMELIKVVRQKNKGKC